MLPGRRTDRNALDLGQRWAYLTGAIQWYGDLLGLAFFVFLLAGAVNLGTGGGQLFRKLTAFLVATVPVLVALGLIRAVALVRRGTGASWRDAIGAFFVWQSTSLVVARASVQGLFARKAAFLRTPKTSEQSKWWEAIRANWAETLLAVLGVAGIVAGLTRLDTFAGPMLAGLLIFPTLGFAAAPFNSLAAQRAALPADLRRRRRSEWARDRVALRGAAVGAGAGLAVAGIAAVLALLVAPSPEPVQPPRLLGPNPAEESAAPSSDSTDSTDSTGSPAPSPTSPGSTTGGTPTGPAGTTGSTPTEPAPTTGPGTTPPVPTPTSPPTTEVPGGTPTPTS